MCNYNPADGTITCIENTTFDIASRMMFDSFGAKLLFIPLIILIAGFFIFRFKLTKKGNVIYIITALILYIIYALIIISLFGFEYMLV